MNRVSGYRVYENDGHMYVDMSQELTLVQEAFYNMGESLRTIEKEMRTALTSIACERCGQDATTH